MMVLGLSTAFEVGAVASVRIFQRGLAMAFLLVVGGCQSLPDNSGRTMSYTLPNGADTRLGRGVATLRVLDYLTHAHVVWVDDLVLADLVRILPGIFSLLI